MQLTDRCDRPPKHTTPPHGIIVETERSTHTWCGWQAGDAISEPLRLLVSSTVRFAGPQPY
jgi:hypothetical protein